MCISSMLLPPLLLPADLGNWSLPRSPPDAVPRAGMPPELFPELLLHLLSSLSVLLLPTGIFIVRGRTVADAAALIALLISASVGVSIR